MEEMLEQAKQGKMRKGKYNFIKYLSGNKITRQQSIQAKCYECNGMGEQDTCDIETCSLLPYSQFRAKTKKVANA